MNAAATAAMTAAGTRARNTDPYQKCASNSPPVTGPTATPSPVTAPQTPMAPARCFRSGYALVMIDNVVG